MYVSVSVDLCSHLYGFAVNHNKWRTEQASELDSDLPATLVSFVYVKIILFLHVFMPIFLT